MVFSILRVLSIDVGKLIAREIVACAKKKFGKWFFPNFIIALCPKAEVNFEGDEEILVDKGIMDTISIVTQGAEKARKSTNMVCRIDEILMEHVEAQQRMYWEYCPAEGLSYGENV